MHQTTYCVNQFLWSVRLASLLPAEVLAVLQSMKKEDQGYYLGEGKIIWVFSCESNDLFSHD